MFANQPALIHWSDDEANSRPSLTVAAGQLTLVDQSTEPLHRPFYITNIIITNIIEATMCLKRELP